MSSVLPWYSVLLLAVLLCILEPSDARLDDYSHTRHHRPRLVDDLKTAWSGLLSYSPADLLLARDVTNATATATAQSRSVRCTVGSTFSLPGSPIRGSSPSASGHPPTTTTTMPSPAPGLPSSIWKLQKDHVRVLFRLQVFT